GMKTNVVLLDTVDYGNGMASVFPDPRIVLYLTDLGDNLHPYKYESWLRFVFTHEYAHILHLDIVEGPLTIYRWLFGRIIFPNGIEPWFITEGLATYIETKYAEGGRGLDPRWEMMMRMDILEDNVKSIEQAGINTVKWPDGHLRYLYGVEFLEYLSDTYGEEKLIDLIHEWGNFAYYFPDGPFYLVYGKSLGVLWHEWLAEAKHKYLKQKEALGQTMEPRLLTDSGHYNLKPKWSRDGQYLYYQQTDYGSYPSVQRIGADGKTDEKLIETYVFANNLSLDPAGKKLYYTKVDTYKNYYSYRDLWVYDLETGRTRPITVGQRVLDADLSPDGRKIVFVKNGLTSHQLMTMNAAGSEPQRLCSFEAQAKYYSPRFSPDGSRVAVAKWVPGGRQKIYLVDSLTGEQTRLTADTGNATEANPCFSPDGDYVYFDSDLTGIVNLYAYHLLSESLSRVTNVIGGAMMPDVSPDGQRLAYVSYSSKGYDVAVMTVMPVMPVMPVMEENGDEDRKLLEVGSYEVHDYNPVPTALPKFWVPETGYGDQTIYTLGTDVLGHHAYDLTYGYDTQTARSQYNLKYIYNAMLPEISVTMSDRIFSTDYRRTGLDLSFTFYDHRVFKEWDYQTLSLGYGCYNRASLEASEYVYRPGNNNELSVSWNYYSSRSYLKSIAPETGYNLSFDFYTSSAHLGSDYEYDYFLGSAVSYWPALLSHHVLVPDLRAFYTKGADQLTVGSSVRGYSLAGNKGIALLTGYRMPLFYIERGINRGMWTLNRVWLEPFFDLGAATRGAVSSLAFKRGYGFDLTASSYLYWNVPVYFRYRFENGLDSGARRRSSFWISM
ncbi:MAG: hypothetical protein ABH823_03885, partial [bacterium]